MKDKKDDFIEVEVFDNMELVIDKPGLNQSNVPTVTSNFEDLSNKIKAVVEKYKDTQLTPENVNYVKTLKSHFVSLRTSIEKERKEWMAIYVTPMKSTVESMCKDLIKMASEGEEALKLQLDAYDQKRKDQLTEVLQEYIQDAIEKYNLNEEFAAKMELKNKYYNVTQKEDDTIDDIDAQAQELAKKQSEHESAIALITAECEGTHLLADTYIRQLDYKSPMELILMIKGDKKKAEEFEKEMKAKEEEGSKIEIGNAENDLAKAIAESTAKQNKEVEIRERVMRVRYTANQATLMAKFFKENNIAFEFIKEDF